VRHDLAVRVITSLFALAIAVTGACGPRPQHAAPLIPPAPRLAPFAVRELLLVPGETLQWDVRVGGLDLGRAELATEDGEIHSAFRTNQVASLLGTMRHELVTRLESSRPVASQELLALGGETTEVSARFDGAQLTVDTNRRTVPGNQQAQTLHTAIAWLRAWARDDDARPGFLFVLHMGELYRLDVERPVRDMRGAEPALRIAARAGVYGSQDDPVSIVVWLRDDPARTPVELRLASGQLVVTARLRQ
jgi:hypothetical protein